MQKYFDTKMILILGLLVITAAAMLSTGAQNTLDTKLYYTADFLREFFNTLSEPQRQAYLLNEYFDLGFMVFYTAFFFLSLKRFYKGWSWVPYLSLGALVFDFLETTSIIFCLRGELSPQDVTFLGWITLGKWLGIAVILPFFSVGALKRYQASS